MEKKVEEKILELLGKGEKSTSEISVNIKKNWYSTTDLLEEMLEKKLIEKLEVGRHLLWKIKNGN